MKIETKDGKTIIECRKLSSWELTRVLKVIERIEDGQEREEEKEQRKEKQFITVHKEVPYKPDDEPVVFEPVKKGRPVGKIEGIKGIGKGNNGQGRNWISGKIRIVMDYIEKHPNLTAVEIQEKLNLKSTATVNHARKLLIRQGRLPERTEKRKPQINQEHIERWRKRMKYISTRTWELVKQYGYDYEKAYRFASNEYDLKYNRPQVELPEAPKVETQKVETKIEQPATTKPTWTREEVQLETITKESQDLLHSMLKNIAGIHQGRINRQITEWYLKRSNGFVWSGRAYEEFFTELLTKIKKICEYLDIKDRFRFNTDTQEVIYMGG